ncbi:hypothetical protein AM588_10007724 [Phytophthora nicotianae]|uniref:Uncharacterized protein n=1 Tax=Phytophthora nicotianae TaxID=4792 RepID=A0A0W8DNY2_PHYNI|nr:hypothetical protein AM588_10007724 [Phytophthora nicotianae]
MELLNMLAAVKNSAFVELMDDLLSPDPMLFGDRCTHSTVYPTWKCSLVGTLPAEADVTWGAIFMCSRDPFETSLEFRQAMEKLETMGLQNLEGGRWIRDDVNWTGRYGIITMGGEQTTADNTDEIKPAASPQQFSRHLGTLFRFEAPPAAQLTGCCWY